jgi:hypothetical protein
MTELFLVPVGDDWIDRFKETIESPLSNPKDAPAGLSDESSVRIWGTTVGEDSKKRTTFEAMEQDDLVLFLHSGEFIGSGRVGETFEDDDLGGWIWDSPESRFIYTVTDYQEMFIPRSEVWDVLGYSPNYPLYGFSRVSDDAINTLLQTYNSVEEAFQDFRTDDPEDEETTPTATTNDEEEDPEDENTRKHTEIQWYLIQLGLDHGYDVYVATNDQNLTYEGNRLGEDCVDSLSLTGFSDAAMRLIEYVDVVWLNDDYIEKMFEVESTTSIYSGILRMTDFVVKVPNLAVDMHIVAPAEDEEQVRRQITRPTFQHVMDRAEHCSLQYISFDEVRDRRKLVEQAGPLQTVF